MPLNTAVMFGRASDEWETPQDFFDRLNSEFDFVLDVAATLDNRKCVNYIGPDHPMAVVNALSIPWAVVVDRAACWMNPPYSRCREFIAKAAEEAQKGCTVVALVPSRTDTRWWFDHVWDGDTHQPRAGVEVRFIKGRLKFGNSDNSAPFPSVVIVFRPIAEPA